MDETLITLTLAAKLIPGRGGKPMSVKAIRRRITHGVRGCKLRAIRNGNDWFTSQLWIQEFFEASTGVPVARTTAVDGSALAVLVTRYGNHGKVFNQRLQKGRRATGSVRQLLSAGLEAG